MARLYEFQGKKLFMKFGIPVPLGEVVGSEDDVQSVLKTISEPLMVKAQVLSGKRGKAGLIQSAQQREEALSISKELLGKKVRYGRVEKLLIEEQLQIENEYYLGITSDPSKRQPVIIFSKSGGVDVEELSENKDNLHKKYVNILKGIEPEEIAQFLKEIDSWSKKDLESLGAIVIKLYTLYREMDCRLAEINPLVVTAKGFFAADARVDIDDDAIFRHRDLGIDVAEETGERPPTLLEISASRIDDGDHRGVVHFVQIDPDMSVTRERGLIPIGFDCVGTGTSLVTMDELLNYGYFPINFADTSGNPTASKMYRATKIILSQPNIKGYIFVSCVSSQQLDNTARGIIKALKELYSATDGKPNIPMIFSFRGWLDEIAIQLYEQHGISKSPLVRMLGRNSTELEAVQLFDSTYKQWAQKQNRKGA